MGVDEIEFHPFYHQNMGPFQDVWLFQNNFSAQIQPPPLVKSHFENTIRNPFFDNFREWRYHLIMKTIVGGG